MIEQTLAVISFLLLFFFGCGVTALAAERKHKTMSLFTAIATTCIFVLGFVEVIKLVKVAWLAN